MNALFLITVTPAGISISVSTLFLKYSIPIMPHNLSTQIAQLVSKTLISGSGSLAALGLYSVASQFANVAETIQVYVNNAYGPWLYERLHEKADGYKKNIANVVDVLCGVIGLAFICIALFAHDYIVLFIDKSYVDAWKFIPLIITVFAIKTVYYFYVNILFYYKEASRLLFVATVSSSVLNVILSALIIPKYGAYGAVLADAISMFVRVAIVIVISKRYEDIGLKISNFVKNFFTVILFVFGGLILSYTMYGDSFSIWNLAYKVLFVLLYSTYIILRHKKYIVGFLKAFKNKKRG